MPVESPHIEPSCPSLLLRLTYQLAELEAIQFVKVMYNLVNLKIAVLKNCTIMSRFDGKKIIIFCA